MDFVTGALADGTRVRVSTRIDPYSRECLALEARARSTGGMAAVLTQVDVTRELPPAVHRERGTEFTSLALDDWAHTRKVALDFSRRAPRRQHRL